MDKDKTSFMLRGTSCVGEPGSNALAALEAGDLTYFVDTLNREDFQGDCNRNRIVLSIYNMVLLYELLQFKKHK